MQILIGSNQVLDFILNWNYLVEKNVWTHFKVWAKLASLFCAHFEVFQVFFVAVARFPTQMEDLSWSDDKGLDNICWCVGAEKYSSPDHRRGVSKVKGRKTHASVFFIVVVAAFEKISKTEAPIMIPHFLPHHTHTFKVTYHLGKGCVPN